MTDALLVLRKLTSLREHLARAERRRGDDPERFREDIDAQDALALSLLVATQEAADIALHIAADEGWGIAGSYAEAFELLARRAVIPADLARELAGVASVRNRIAHGYGSVDVERLWREVPAGAAALARFAEAVARWMDPGGAA